MFESIIDYLGFYLSVGGFVMPPLVVATLLLWFGLGYRYSVLRRGNRGPVRTLIERQRKGELKHPKGMVESAVVEGVALFRKNSRNLRRRLEDAFNDYKPELRRFRTLVRSIVIASPLLGLLGTVVGMVETFDSLRDMQLFSQSGGIAGGISQALFTTQFGLAVAVPGLLIEGFLERRQQQIEMELAQIKDVLCTMDNSLRDAPNKAVT